MVILLIDRLQGELLKPPVHHQGLRMVEPQQPPSSIVWIPIHLKMLRSKKNLQLDMLVCLNLTNLANIFHRTPTPQVVILTSTTEGMVVGIPVQARRAILVRTLHRMAMVVRMVLTALTIMASFIILQMVRIKLSGVIDKANKVKIIRAKIIKAVNSSNKALWVSLA